MQSGPFELERFTNRPEILQYSKDLSNIYKTVKPILVADCSSELARLDADTNMDTDIKNHIINKLKKNCSSFPEALKYKIVEDENWLLKVLQQHNKVRGKRTVYHGHVQRGGYNIHILNGLFLKVYGAQNECTNWPPLTYPPSAPLLVYVPGIHGESNKEWFMRILHMIGGNKTHVDWKADTRGYPARHIYETAWLSDPYIEAAFYKIKIALQDGVPRNEILPRLLGRSGTSESIIDAFTRDGEVVGDVIHSKMNSAGRFFSNLQGWNTINDMFDRVDRPATEFDVEYTTRSIMSSKLSRTELPWAQQLFIITYPANTLKTLTGSLPAADTVWIDVAKRNEDEYSVIQGAYDNEYSVIQGAYMPSSPEFLRIYYKGIAGVSKKLLEKLRGQETHDELDARISETSKRNPKLSIKQVLDIVDATPFTLDGKKPLKRDKFFAGTAYHGAPNTNKGNIAALNVRGDMLAANLRNLRRHTFKTPAWHFWKKSAKTKIGEIIKKYELFGKVGLDVQRAALALQSHHTEANKEELIRALEGAVRKQRATYKRKTSDTVKQRPINVEYKVSSETEGKPKKIVIEKELLDILPADILIEDLREYMLIKNDAGRILEEMKKSWLFNKSKKLIKELQNKYLERFEIKTGYRNLGKPVRLSSEPTLELQNLDGPGKSALDVEILMALRDLKNEQTLKTLLSRIEAAIGHNEKMFRLSMKEEGRMNSDAILDGILLKQGPVKYEVRSAPPEKYRKNLGAYLMYPFVGRIPKRATVKSGRPGRKSSIRIPPQASPHQPMPATSPQPVPVTPPQPVSATSPQLVSVGPLPQASEQPYGSGLQFTSPVRSGVQSLSPVPNSKQVGGWSPSLMASFAVNGMRLLPVAGYMGYKMFKNRKTKKRRRQP